MRTALTAMSFLMLSSVALAQEPQTTAALQFIDIEAALDVTGDIVKPKGLVVTKMQRARHQRLLDLRRNFLERIPQTAKDIALR